MTAGTLVLGLGNILLHDEGLGVWVADALRRQFEFPTSVTILEGGTLGLDLTASGPLGKRGATGRKDRRWFRDRPSRY